MVEFLSDFCAVIPGTIGNDTSRYFHGNSWGEYSLTNYSRPCVFATQFMFIFCVIYFWAQFNNKWLRNLFTTNLLRNREACAVLRFIYGFTVIFTTLDESREIVSAHTYIIRKVYKVFPKSIKIVEMLRPDLRRHGRLCHFVAPAPL